MRFSPVLVAALLCACSAAARRASSAPFPLGADILPQDGYLSVAGYGLPEGPASTPTQLKARTRDAALLDARARLKAYLESIAPPTAAAKAAALAKRARVVYVNWEEDGAATALIALDKDDINEELGVSFR